MNRCNHCLTKAEPEDGACSICEIGPNKKKKDLSQKEKKVRKAARGIRGVVLFHLALFVTGVTALLTAKAGGETPEHFAVQMTILLSSYTILLITAFGLARYAYWAYKVTTTFYFLIGIMFTISVQIPGVLIILLLLYLIGNGTAKAIFERRALS